MKFYVNDKIKYDGFSGIITAYFEKTENYKKAFQGEFSIDNKQVIILFDKDGFVFPFTKNSNQQKVTK